MKIIIENIQQLETAAKWLDKSEARFIIDHDFDIAYRGGYFSGRMRIKQDLPISIIANSWDEVDQGIVLLKEYLK